MEVSLGPGNFIYLFIYLFAKNTHSNHNWDKDMIAGQQGTSVH